MSSKRAQSSLKWMKNNISSSKDRKITIKAEKKTMGNSPSFVTISFEEILDRIAACERKGDITHVQALEVAERYAATKQNEVVVPVDLYNSWLDNDC